ncbi:hypothetical protein [Flavobacterium sharifuzzamanii]|uniref:hypothetical protein n=1 Tax=Flavobacterium sharifuzzamanii TaxID=2211133 RepID=UPI0013004974|nr:hypothetical protein [Flavobacterium sharifuzzamanii]KAF2082733.1 hypothetical protein DMA14_02225 [Flavobacterium sharifuzzamanii]
MYKDGFKDYCYIYGYSSDISVWIKKSIELFSEIGFILKSVSYDINYERFERKSLNKFLNEFDLDNEASVEKLYSFTIFYGKNLKYPDSWSYGVRFDKPSSSLQIFFDKSVENSAEIILKILQSYLEDKIINFGYFSLESPAGRETSLNLYKEDNHSWWLALNPRNRQILYNSSPKLRHIYPCNIINRDFYYYKEKEFSFKEWIKDSENGTLKKIGSENWLWTVPHNRLHEIGKLFYEKNLLLGVKDTAFNLI